MILYVITVDDIVEYDDYRAIIKTRPPQTRFLEWYEPRNHF